MQHWLVKTEPDVYSWEQFVSDGSTFWDGVRNYEARNNMRAMKKGDLVVFYHTGDERQAVGIAKVVKEAYQDPTTDDAAWVVVDLAPVKPLATPYTLAQAKAHPILCESALAKKGRISVISLTK
ncbi:MAG: EVE domain-containing protein, partial [Candidatus Kapaibacteriota bacterium]